MPNNLNVPKNIAHIAFTRPIPGNSWAAHPPRSQPYQKPPRFTKIEEVMPWLFERLHDPMHFKEMLNLMDGGMSVEALARTILFTGFTQGLWTVDLMLLMFKPTMMSLVAIAHRQKLKHTPVVLPESYNKYHNNKLQKFMVTSAAKKQSLDTDNMPPMPDQSQPAPQQQGYMNRPQ